MKLGYLYRKDFVFQNLAEFRSRGQFEPPWDFDRKGPQWPQMFQTDTKQVI